MSTRKSSELEWTGTLQRPGGSSPQSTNEHSENTGTGANHTAGLVAYADLIPSASCNSTYPKHVEVNIQNTGTQSMEVSTTCQDSRRRTGCGCQHSSTPYSEIRLNQLVKNFDAQFSQHSQLKFLMWPQFVFIEVESPQSKESDFLLGLFLPCLQYYDPFQIPWWKDRN